MRANGSMQEYAREGLRTLVVAQKDLTLEEYNQWAAQHHAARCHTQLGDLIHCKHVVLCLGDWPGPLAQSVERRADNAKAVSSRLTWTILFFSIFFPSF